MELALVGVVVSRRAGFITCLLEFKVEFDYCSPPDGFAAGAAPF
jgi:hypothetical protein